MAKLRRGVLVLLFLVLLFGGLHFAQEFLAPIVLAGVLAMLFIGFSNYLERHGMGRALSALVSVLVLVGVFAIIITVLSWQLQEFAGDVSVMKQKVGLLIDDIKSWVGDKLKISQKQQNELLSPQEQGGGAGAGAIITNILAALSNLAVNTVLCLVYMYLLLFYRGHIKQFFLKILPDDQSRKTDLVIHQCARVAQKYLGGLSIMIMMLWVLYGIGFSIVGVKNAIFFAILCGILEIIPFVGNVTGTTVTALAVLVQGGSQGMVMGVVGTYLAIQFVQTYVLEPLVVGEQVSVNPLFTIMALVLGELVWGIPGMILAIPLLGIVKIICDAVPELEPYGFLIGTKGKTGGASWGRMFKRVFKKNS